MQSLNNIYKFWMCFIPSCGRPTKRHSTIEDAKEEAARLAKKEMYPVAILECVGFVKPVETPTEFVPSIPRILTEVNEEEE